MNRWELFLNLFKTCNNQISVTQLHSLIIKTGYIEDNILATKLNNCYAIYTTPESTRKLFDETPQRTVYIWNSTLRCYCRGKLYQETLQLFKDMINVERPDHVTVPIALKACSGLQQINGGRMIHGFVKKNPSVDSDMFVGCGLINLYSRCGLMNEAVRVFEEYSCPDVVLWTHIVSGYEQNGDPDEALAFFTRMMVEGDINPDPVALVSVVSACVQPMNLKAGRSVHAFLTRKGFANELSLYNALLNLYTKAGSVNAAANLFREMVEKDVISWASMIACYAHNEYAEEALKLFDEMICRRTEPNSVTVLSALQACEATCNLEAGKRLHEIAVRKGFELDILVSTALIDMYMACSSPDEAIDLFNRMPKRDAVSWTAFLCGSVQNGMSHKSMEIFCSMLSSEIQPDSVVMVKILTACSELGILQQALCLHSYVIRKGFGENVFVRASLIESYSKCGGLDNAIKIFEATENRDIFIWSSMIMGYGIHGQGREALGLFDQMVKTSAVSPNNVTFLSVLSACSHAGLVEEGMRLFGIMVNDYHLIPESNHYTIMVDLFGRTGDLDKAIDIINQMPGPVGPHVWGALLGACRKHHNAKLGEVAARNLFQSDSSHPGYFILLSNIYAVDRDWENVAKLRALVKEKKLNKKTFGHSAVEVRSEVHSFVADDRFHPDSETIYAMLRRLEAMMKDEGYIPDVDFPLDD